jgi:hypothetical protein
MKPQGIFTLLLADNAAVWPEHCIQCPFALMNGQKQLVISQDSKFCSMLRSTPCDSYSVYLLDYLSDLW